jgi:hypothetical protein
MLKKTDNHFTINCKIQNKIPSDINQYKNFTKFFKGIKFSFKNLSKKIKRNLKVFVLNCINL